MSMRDHLILRVRAHQAQYELSDDTNQLLRDVEAALLAKAPGPLDVVQPNLIIDAWLRGQQSKEALIAAALDHADESGSTTFFVALPDTEPPVIVALGEPAKLLRMLRVRAELTDN